MAPVVDLAVSVIGTLLILGAAWLIVAAVVWLVRTYHRPKVSPRVRPARSEPICYRRELTPIGGPPSWESVKRSDR